MKNLRLEDFPEHIQESLRSKMRKTGKEHLAAVGVKKPRRKPVLVRAAIFCTRCGSYQHERDTCLVRAIAEEFKRQGFALPLRTENDGNGTHGHWATSNERHQQIKTAVRKAWTAAEIKLRCAGYRVTITRISAGDLDRFNLDQALKYVIDSVASCMGVDDSTPLVEFVRKQERGEVGKPAVRIEVEEV